MIGPQYTGSQLVMATELYEHWKGWTKRGFNHTDKLKLLIWEAKHHWLITNPHEKRVITLEVLGRIYKDESEEKFDAYCDMIQILINPQEAVNKLIAMDEYEMEEHNRRRDKWHTDEEPLILTKEWNDLWLKPFDKPTKEETK